MPAPIWNKILKSQISSSETRMDIEDSLKQLLDKFVKDVKQASNDDPNAAQLIETMKWKIMCMFSSTTNHFELSYNIQPIQVGQHICAETKY